MSSRRIWQIFFAGLGLIGAAFCWFIYALYYATQHPEMSNAFFLGPYLGGLLLGVLLIIASAAIGVMRLAAKLRH